jgi:hypothetical protein
MAWLITDKSDVKIFILYLLMRIDRPVDFVTLNDIAVQDGYVGQIDFMNGFYELKDTNAISSRKSEDGEEMWEITSAGVTAAQTLKSSVMPEIMEKAARSALALISFKHRNTRISSTVKKDSSEKYVLNMVAKDGDNEFMNVSLSFDSQHTAETMKNNFDRSPELVYRGLLGVLSGDINYLADAWNYGPEEEKNNG